MADLSTSLPHIFHMQYDIHVFINIDERDYTHVNTSMNVDKITYNTFNHLCINTPTHTCTHCFTGIAIPTSLPTVLDLFNCSFLVQNMDIHVHRCWTHAEFYIQLVMILKLKLLPCTFKNHLDRWTSTRHQAAELFQSIYLFPQVYNVHADREENVKLICTSN